MRRILTNYHFLKTNLANLIGVMLCLYFGYHAVFGYRSFLSLNNLQQQIEQSVSIRDNAVNQRQLLQADVSAMRPDSLDYDMVEQRARAVLGYTRINEVVVLGN